MGDHDGDILESYKYVPPQTSSSATFSNTTNPKPKTKHKRVKKRKTTTTGRGITTKAPRYTITLDFSEDGGDSFDAPVVLEKGTVGTYAHLQVRMTLTQHQVLPLLQGVKLRWTLPAGGASWEDGFGEYTYEVCVSNPLVVVRLAKVPRNASLKTYFKVAAVALYSTAVNTAAPNLPIIAGSANVVTAL